MSDVEEPIKFPDILTEDWYNKQVNIVKKSEILANKAEALKKKLAAGVPPIQTTTPTETANLPRGFEETISTTGTKPLAAGIPPVPFQLGQDFISKITKQITATQKLQGGLQQGANIAQQIVSAVQNPSGAAVTGLMQILKAAGPEALIAAFGIEFATQMAQTIFKMYSDMYGAGGWFDTRKLVLDQTKVMTPLKTLINIESGQVFFSPDAGQSLKQNAPESSNTRTLRDGQARYNLLHLGEG